MPYAYRKIRGKNAYKVFNKVSGVIHSNSTSLENAKKQIQLLNAIEKNPNFKPKKGGMVSDSEEEDNLTTPPPQPRGRPRTPPQPSGRREITDSPTLQLPSVIFRPPTTTIPINDAPVAIPPSQRRRRNIYLPTAPTISQSVSPESSAPPSPQGEPSTKIRRTGTGLEVKNIQLLLKNSYQIPPARKVGEFNLDKTLSGRRVQVYTRTNSKQVVVVHRGTQGTKDWATDLYYSTGGDTSKTRRFQHALQVQKKAEAKYGAENITSIGHSLGSLVNSTVAQNSKEIINLNKAVSPLDAVKKTSDKEINIRTSGDPVSALLPIRQQNKRTITIPSKTYNPLTEHSTDTLGRLPPNRIIGAGLTPQEINAVVLSSPFGALFSASVIAGLYRFITNLQRVAPEPEPEQEEETKDATDIEMGEGLDSPEDEGREATLIRRDREQASLDREQAESIPIYADELMSGIRNPDIYVRNIMINVVRNQGLNRMNNRINQIRRGINNNPRIYNTEQVREALRDIETARAIVFYQHNQPDNPETRGQGVGLAKKISPPIKKMKGKTNPWVDYVRSFAKDKGMNYGLALKHPDLSKGYKKGGMIDGGRGMPTSKEAVIAETYNESQLGAQGGKKYVSL